MVTNVKEMAQKTFPFCAICDRDLRFYLKRLAPFVSFNPGAMYVAARNILKQHNGVSVSCAGSIAHGQLEQRWYTSLDEGAPDFGVYNHEMYAAELWLCWVMYSRKYLLDLARPSVYFPHGFFASHSAVRGIVDLGCGFGYTLAGLHKMFPAAQVTGINLADTWQYKFVDRVVADYKIIHVCSDLNAVKHPVDLVFASEFFEHVPAPVDYLRNVVDALNPSTFVIANAFSARAIGHFNTYVIDGQQVENKKVSRAFNAALRSLGYTPVKTGFWNNRPAVWVKG